METKTTLNPKISYQNDEFRYHNPPEPTVSEFLQDIDKVDKTVNMKGFILPLEEPLDLEAESSVCESPVR